MPLIKAAVFICFVFVPSVFSQYELFCEKLEQIVSAGIGNARRHRNNASSNGCNIEFTRPDLHIDIEVSKTEREAQKEFDKTVRLFRTIRIDEALDAFEDLNVSGSWDKALIIIPRERGSSYVMVLLRNKYLITSLSASKETLSNIEKILRGSEMISANSQSVLVSRAR